MGIICFGCYVLHIGLTLIPAAFNGTFLTTGSLFIIVGTVSMTTVLFGICGVILLKKRLLLIVSALVTSGVEL